MQNIDFYHISPKAIAVAQKYSYAFDKLLRTDDKYKKYDNVEFRKALRKVLAFYAAGQINPNLLDMNNSDSTSGENLSRAKLRAEIFGSRSFDLTLKEVVNTLKKRFPDECAQLNPEVFYRDALKTILAPAMDKYLTMYKTMVCLPGLPTDFAGDRLAVTGHESFAKNIYQANRELLDWGKLAYPEDNFYRNFYADVNQIAGLRKTPEVQALNDGAVVFLTPFEIDYKTNSKKWIKTESADEEKSKGDVISLMRYNDKGSIVITSFVNDGIKVPKTVFNPEEQPSNDYNAYVNNKLDRKGVYLDEIVLTPAHLMDENPKAGLVNGLPEGMTFKKFDINGNETPGVYRVVNQTLVFDNDGKFRKIKTDGAPIPDNWKVRIRSVLKYFPDENSDRTEKIYISPEDKNVAVFYKV